MCDAHCHDVCETARNLIMAVKINFSVFDGRGVIATVVKSFK